MAAQRVRNGLRRVLQWLKKGIKKKKTKNLNYCLEGCLRPDPKIGRKPADKKTGKSIKTDALYVSHEYIRPNVTSEEMARRIALRTSWKPLLAGQIVI